MNKKIFSSRKFKYGSVAVVLTAVFIAVIIAFNVFISAIDAKKGLYLDMTSERIYDISPASDALLSGLDKKVEIIFCRDADKIDEMQYVKEIKTLAEKYAARYGNIEIKYLDVVRQNEELKKFKTTTSTTISTESIIINCPESNKFKLLSFLAFYTFAESDPSKPFAFNGEMRLTSSIVSVANNNTQNILFTKGQGEAAPPTALAEILYNSGYENMSYIDLSTQDIPENTKLIIINDPVNDFAGTAAEKEGAKNEIAALNKYLQSGGNLLVFLNNETGTLTELSEFLRDDWGIEYHSGELIHESAGNSPTSDGYSIIAKYAASREKDKYAYEVIKPFVESKSTPSQIIVRKATPLYIVSGGNTTVSPVLSSSSEASIYSGKNTVASGVSSPVLVMSTYETIENNQSRYSHVIVSGSTELCSSNYIASQGASAYGNADLFYSIMKVIGTEKVPIDIDFKVFDDTSIKTALGMSSVTAMTVILTVIIPLLIFVLGTIVFVRRKHL